MVKVHLIKVLYFYRQGVKESVALCQGAGIRVIMITGDHINTAVSHRIISTTKASD